MSETPAPEMDSTIDPETEPTQEDKLFAALSYVFSPLVPIVLFFLDEQKARPFIKAHHMQSLITGAVLTIVGFIPFVNCTVPILWLYNVYNGYRAFQGETFDIPIISDFVRNQNL